MSHKQPTGWVPLVILECTCVPQTANWLGPTGDTGVYVCPVSPVGPNQLAVCGTHVHSSITSGTQPVGCLWDTRTLQYHQWDPTSWLFVGHTYTPVSPVGPNQLAACGTHVHSHKQPTGWVPLVILIVTRNVIFTAMIEICILHHNTPSQVAVTMRLHTEGQFCLHCSQD